MTGDPDTCREHAEKCLEKGEETGHMVWFEMAQQWVKLASMAESANPFMEFLRALEREWKD